jgi:hypothetical protein
VQRLIDRGPVQISLWILAELLLSLRLFDEPGKDGLESILCIFLVSDRPEGGL